MLSEHRFTAPDGENHRVLLALPGSDKKPHAVVVAVHGFNDHAGAFADVATFLGNNAVAVYAYDQRGFGDSRVRGFWPGVSALTDDLKWITGEVRKKHPGTPLYLLGESMGGAVVMAALASPAPPYVDGVILSAPALWGRDTMPFYQRWALEAATHTVPWLELTGKELGIQASDNIEMLKRLARDPRFIHQTRVDAMAGLADLMDVAEESVGGLGGPALILYGEKDEVIPKEPVLQALRRLPPNRAPEARIALYKNGWHMLMRDLQANTVWADILAWIEGPAKPLPSGADKQGAAWLAGTHRF